MRKCARITQAAILIDTHNDVTSHTVEGFDIGERSTTVFFAVYVSGDYAKTNNPANRFQLAYSADDVVAAHKAGKIAALMGIEGGHAIEDSPGLLRDFYLLGVRYMTLTHSNTNNRADSSGDIDDPKVQHHNGLTPLGKHIVREMNRLGMIVDISHVADKTFWDALDFSTAPLLASHSSCRALANTAAFSPPKSPTTRPSRTSLPISITPLNWRASIQSGSAAISAAYPAALLEKGYSNADILKIYGGNTLRLMREVQANASLNK